MRISARDKLVNAGKSKRKRLKSTFEDHPCLHYATCCWMALAVQACGTGRTVRHGGTAHLRGEKTKVLQVSSTTYRRRQEWLQSCYEMTLTELLYLTWPRSPQNPVSVEYSRLDTYLQSACSVCVRYTVGKHHNASVRSCS
ncbi:uncharacterized protein [Triticum aestivum]|uniref:uncharacterized protein isoform X2 n=1 Tax=Triticum aestivum TaxID=4565 RepID=UPI001D01F3A0|nr:uncharacterized protein LOC123050755 isoform X2 [Triticum aestivum]